MSRKVLIVASIACLFIATAVYAGMGYAMKCNAKPPAGSDQACGYKMNVTFGGGMMFEQLGGYCRACKTMVHLSWTRPNLPAGMGINPKPKPQPLGEVWNAKTGEVITVWPCPKCNGPFAEIRSAKEFKHCPKCNEPHFAIDPDAPVMAID